VSNINNRSIGRAGSVASLMLCLAGMVGAAAQATPLPELKPVEVEVDITGIPASEQAALVPILRAARIMDALYMRQVWPGTSGLIKQREDAKTPAVQAERDALSYFKSPWDWAGSPFIDGVPAVRPAGDFYPMGATKHDIDAWLATLAEPERKWALDSFTAIEQEQNGCLNVLPYSVHYKEGLVEAAAALREAASLTREKTLKKFLTLRAQALLDDNYYASDVAFVGLKGPIDVVLGPYEVDNDGWFGVKTAYEASIALLNGPATERIKRISSRMQELEDHLPLSRELRGRKLPAAAPIVVLDAIYHSGYTATMFAVSYGLPNDLRVLDTVGGRTGTYSNIIKLRYDTTYKPIADAALTLTDTSKLRFEDIRDEITFVHVFDSLGPQLVTGTKQPIADALREDGSVASMIRSMLLSLWGHRYVIEHGYIDPSDAATRYSAFLVPALSRARGGLHSCTPCQGSTYILNHLLEAGAVALDADGRLKIDSAAADADIVRAAKEFISPMAKGDAKLVKSLLQHYAVVTPTIRDILARLGPTPGLLRPIYTTADRLSR
jgi:hypothetical protein